MSGASSTSPITDTRAGWGQLETRVGPAGRDAEGCRSSGRGKPPVVSKVCPCCGERLRKAPLAVDLNSNSIVHRDRAIRVAPKVAELVHILATAYPAKVRREAIYAGLWGSVINEPGNAYGCVKTYVTMARRALRSLGWDLENMHDTYNTGRGSAYRLVQAKEAAR